MVISGVGKIHISKTPNEISEMDFPDDGGRGGISPSPIYLSPIGYDHFTGEQDNGGWNFGESGAISVYKSDYVFSERRIQY